MVALSLVNFLLALHPDRKDISRNRSAILMELIDVEAPLDDWTGVAESPDTGSRFMLDLGVALAEMQLWEQAVSCFDSASRLDPGWFEPHLKIGSAHMKHHRYQAAFRCVERSVSLAADNIESQIALANALYHLGEGVRGLEVLGQLEQAGVSLGADYYFVRGNINSSMGARRKAASCYRQCLEIDANQSSAYRLLVQMVEPEEILPLTRKMEALLESKQVTNAQKTDLAYGLSRAYREMEDDDLFILKLTRAHQLKRSLPMRGKGEYQVFRNTLDDYQKLASFYKTAQSPHWDDAEFVPLFIAGMPRSGTTLIEQVIASHSLVDSAGEVAYLETAIQMVLGPSEQTLGELCGEASSSQLVEVRNEYLRLLSFHKKAGKYVIDKQLSNYLHMGLLSLLFPGAPVIFTHRNPMDICFSIYSNYFAVGNTYATDQVEIVSMYRLHREALAFWNQVRPGNHRLQSYEALVGDPGVQVRELLSHCGLDYEDACANFHTRTNTVRTISYEQVRKPFYQSSIHKWKQFEKHLQPMLHELDKSGYREEEQDPP